MSNECGWFRLGEEFKAEQDKKANLVPDGWQYFNVVKAQKISGKRVEFLIEITIEDGNGRFMRHRFSLAEEGIHRLYHFVQTCGINRGEYKADYPFWVLLPGKEFFGCIEYNHIGPRLKHWRSTPPDDQQ